MISLETILPVSTYALAGTLLIDTLMRPKSLYQQWSRSLCIKKIRRQFKASQGNWIIFAGTQKSGKSSLFQVNQWQHKKSIYVGSTNVDVWQYQDQPLFALEIGFADMGGISPTWWESLQKLKPKRIYYCLTFEECKRFKATHTSNIETHIIISHADQIQGFSPFMSELSEKNLTFPIGNHSGTYANSHLQDAFDTLNAQLQAYANQLLNRTSSPDVKRIINDFPQHLSNLQLGLNKIIKSMPVKQIYCSGQIWKNGVPKIIFAPPIASDLNVINQSNIKWQKWALSLLIILISIQIVFFKDHITQLWAEQPLAKITQAQEKIKTLETKNYFLKQVGKFISPTFRLSNQQQDEAIAMANDYITSLNSMSPLIAAIEARKLQTLPKENPQANQAIQTLLQDKYASLQATWSEADDKSQFLASLHAIHGHKKLDEPFPQPITINQTKTACLALTNRMSLDDCIQASKKWSGEKFTAVSSIEELIKTIEAQTYDAAIQPTVNELTTWLKEISHHPKKSYVTFSFLLKHFSNKPDHGSTILKNLQALENNHSELKQLNLITWQLILNEGSQYIDTIWKRTVFPYYIKHFEKSYPLVKDSPQDASLSAFNQFYGAGGLINIYYNHYLSPFVDSHTQQLKSPYPGANLPIKSESLQYFKTVAAIQTLLYQGEPTPHIEVNFNPTYTKESWSIKSNQLTLPMNKDVIVGWPSGISQNGIDIYDGKKKIHGYKGVWAFWRWFESGAFNGDTLSFHNHAFKVSGQTSSDLTWLNILRSEKPTPSLLNN